MQGTHLSLDPSGKEEEVKVKDLIAQLENHDPEADIVLKENDGRNVVHHRQIRAYIWDSRVQVDGYDPQPEE